MEALITESRTVSLTTVEVLLAFLGRSNVTELSERDLATLLFQSFKRVVCFNPETGTWERYEPSIGRWIKNESHHLAHHASRVGNLLRSLAKKSDDKTTRQTLVTLAKKIESRNGLNAVLYFASSNPDARVGSAKFDISPLIIGLGNGVYDIQSGRLLESAQKYYVTKSCDAEFNPFATCPTWLSILDRVVGDMPAEERQPMLDFLQQIAGEAILYQPGRRRFYFFGGPPGTGKSLFTNTLKDLLGDYSVALPPDAIMTSRTGGDCLRPEMMTLPGARMLLLSEAGDGQCFDDDTIKRLTGGDPITVRGLYQAPITFKVGALIWLTGNSYPRSKTGGAAFMSRICIVNFQNQVPIEQQDMALADKLRSEYSGILNWALLGAKRVIDGTPATWPERVKKDTMKYRETADHVKLFVTECCRVDPDGHEPKRDMYQTFSLWCKENGHPELKALRFNQRLEDLGYAEKRKGGRRGIGGLTLLARYSFCDGMMRRIDDYQHD